MRVRFGLSVPNRGVVIGAGDPEGPRGDVRGRGRLGALRRRLHRRQPRLEAPGRRHRVPVARGGPNPPRDPRDRLHGELRLPAPDRAGQPVGRARPPERRPDAPGRVHRRRPGHAPRAAVAERGEVGDGVRGDGGAGRRARRPDGGGDGDPARPLDRRGRHPPGPLLPLRGRPHPRDAGPAALPDRDRVEPAAASRRRDDDRPGAPPRGRDRRRLAGRDEHARGVRRAVGAGSAPTRARSAATRCRTPR